MNYPNGKHQVFMVLNK